MKAGLRSTCLALLALDLATIAAVLVGTTGPWRVVLALAFASSVPGGALVAHRPPRDPITAAAVTVALSWAVTVLLNDGLAELGWWAPDTVLVVLGAACAGSLGAAMSRTRPELVEHPA